MKDLKVGTERVDQCIAAQSWCLGFTSVKGELRVSIVYIYIYIERERERESF